ncbi:MAG: putative nucleic acid-binding protein [Oleiphilaceae bacterium]
MRIIYLTSAHPETVFFRVVLPCPPEKILVSGRALTSNYKLLSSEILPYEIGNALSAIVKRKQLTTEQAMQAIELAEAIPVRLIQPDIKSSLEIALRSNTYSYDAYFLQCTLSLNYPLLTLDKKMKEVAK